MAKHAVAPPAAKIAAIDVGSNAMRMLIAQILPGFQLRPLQVLREPVRLGKDVFTSGVISERNLRRSVAAFRKFKTAIEKAGVSHFRAVATSATRESSNRDAFLDSILKETGIPLETIAGEEEARLVYMAVCRRLPLGDRTTLVVDIGGGSVELIFGRNSQVIALESLKMGTVRILSRLQSKNEESPEFLRRAREYVEATRGWIEPMLAEHRVETFVATGGNAEEIGDLAQRLFAKDRNDLVTRTELAIMLERLEASTFEERQKKFGLRADRADVIIPAAIVLEAVMDMAGAETLILPHVGLKDGLLEDLMREQLGQRPAGADVAQALAASHQLGPKYDYDAQHARKVADLALQLFDQTQPLHKLSVQHRLLLESAGLLHDIGKFINFSNHHKHSHYIISSSRLVGLNDNQKAIVAAVARYHRKSPPSLTHNFYRELSPADRTVVDKLSALLRLAETLDAEHDCKVDSLQVKLAKNKIFLSLKGQGDLLLERWSAEHKGQYLDRALGAKLVLTT